MHSTPEHVRSHIAAHRASRSYGVVLALIVVSLVYIAWAPADTASTGVLVLLVSLTLIAALWTSRAGPIGFRAVLAGVGIAAALAQLVFGGETLSGLIGLLTCLLIVGIAGVITRGVASERRANAQAVIGAVCIYLLLGLFFALLYGAAAELGSGPFFAQGTDGTPSIRLYFSIVTQTTVGYGDYTAAGSLGRSLAMTEALMGQLYLVTVIGVLVARLRPGLAGPASR